MPFCALKYLPKKDAFGKLSRYAISLTGICVWHSIRSISLIVSSRIHSVGVLPLMSFTTVARYLGVMHILEA